MIKGSAERISKQIDFFLLLRRIKFLKTIKKNNYNTGKYGRNSIYMRIKHQRTNNRMYCKTALQFYTRRCGNNMMYRNLGSLHYVWGKKQKWILHAPPPFLTDILLKFISEFRRTIRNFMNCLCTLRVPTFIPLVLKTVSSRNECHFWP